MEQYKQTQQQWSLVGAVLLTVSYVYCKNDVTYK